MSWARQCVREQFWPTGSERLKNGSSLRVMVSHPRHCVSCTSRPCAPAPPPPHPAVSPNVSSHGSRTTERLRFVLLPGPRGGRPLHR